MTGTEYLRCLHLHAQDKCPQAFSPTGTGRINPAPLTVHLLLIPAPAMCSLANFYLPIPQRLTGRSALCTRNLHALALSSCALCLPFPWIDVIGSCDAVIYSSDWRTHSSTGSSGGSSSTSRSDITNPTLPSPHEAALA
jgi:hypothetical protein